jgi:nitrate reductase gamma subunit
MRILGIVLTFGFYLSILIFLGNYAVKVLIWLKDAPSHMERSGRIRLRTFMAAACDILFFRRLLSANDVLWFGEWAFHVSFMLVILRHLRYFLNPVPHWIWAVQTPGIIAGYLLPITLVYILVVKALSEMKYFSSYNFLLLLLIFVISINGLLMKTIYRPDIVSVKAFIMGILGFGFPAVPGSFFFILHFILVLLLIANLPTHIFAAPLTLIGARQREENLQQVIHER